MNCFSARRDDEDPSERLLAGKKIKNKTFSKQRHLFFIEKITRDPGGGGFASVPRVPVRATMTKNRLRT